MGPRFPSSDLGGVLQTNDYRKIFKLRYRRQGYNPAVPSAGYDRDDFNASLNESLTQVARAHPPFGRLRADRNHS